MLVYASLIPHLPIIDKNDPHVTPESVTVLNEISRIGLELYAAKPDTIV
ncbi:hypothetical protein IT409_01060, partial [Candidatus Falkowbacteria bacterium]|nr:hypothetical protein [Candidatus Falkowbacteria bacterium]